MKGKNKTFAAWLAFLGGPLGLHRFYLHGIADWLGWLLPVPTLLGLYGIERAQQYGLDDKWSWVLIPMLGFVVAGCSLMAIVYGLATREKWNRWFNPEADPEAPSGKTSWWTIAAVVLSLMVGTIALVSGIAMSFQQYFDYQVEEGRKISE
jgi:hypothetical protein